MLDSLVMVAAVRGWLLHGDDRLGARHHAHHPLQLPLPLPLPRAMLLLLPPPVAAPLPSGTVLRLDLPRVAAMHGDPTAAAAAAAAHRALAVVDQAAR